MAATDQDLTAKARIRNVALELFAISGPAATPLRAIADRAGVTVGLITHHFGSKDALGEAVDDFVVQTYRETLNSVPLETPGVAAARDAAMVQMLAVRPDVAAYLRRSYIDPVDGGVLDRLIDLTLEQVRDLRSHNLASVTRSERAQTAYVVVRQLGVLMVQPLADRAWRQLGGDADAAPQISIGIEQAADAASD